jgi:YHS domain-containing protein
MLRLVLLIVLFIVVARVFWRFVDNIVAAANGQPGDGSRTPQQGVAMARDPVCGTFVLPDRAVSIVDGNARVYFCSAACREKFRAGQSRERPRTHGRTA